MSTCVNDRVTCLQHITHRLEISYGYAKHYLDVFRLMSNLQVTCVDMCQRSRNVPTTYGQHYAERVSHTLAYVEKFQAWKICLTPRRTMTYASVQRRMPAYYDVCQHMTHTFRITLAISCRHVTRSLTHVDTRYL